MPGVCAVLLVWLRVGNTCSEIRTTFLRVALQRPSMYTINSVRKNIVLKARGISQWLKIRVMTSVITRLLECQVDKFDIADRLYTLGVPFSYPPGCILTPITNSCARRTSQVVEARKADIRCQGGRKIESRHIVVKGSITSTTEHHTVV